MPDQPTSDAERRERFVQEMLRLAAQPGPHPPRIGPPDGVVELTPGHYEFQATVRENVLAGWHPEEFLETLGWIYERLEGKRVRIVIEEMG